MVLCLTSSVFQSKTPSFPYLSMSIWKRKSEWRERERDGTSVPGMPLILLQVILEKSVTVRGSREEWRVSAFLSLHLSLSWREMDYCQNTKIDCKQEMGWECKNSCLVEGREWGRGMNSRNWSGHTSSSEEDEGSEVETDRSKVIVEANDIKLDWLLLSPCFSD